jgi:hypothetical protein
MRAEALHGPARGSVPGASPAAVPLPQASQQWQAALQQERQRPSVDGAAAPVDAALPAAPPPALADAALSDAALLTARPRVAWRDASSSSTWLAPVRPRAEEDAAAGDAAAAADAGPATAAASHHAPSGSPEGAEAGPDEPGQGPAFPGAGVAAARVPAEVPAAVAMPGRAPGVVPGLAGPSAPGQARPLAQLPAEASRPLSAPVAGLARPPAQLPGPEAGTPQQPQHVAPRQPPPAGTPPARTHLHMTPGDDGVSVWLRDATQAPQGPWALRLLQALADLGGPALRPGSLHLNGRRIWSAASGLAGPRPEPQAGLLPSPPLSQEDPHGH